MKYNEQILKKAEFMGLFPIKGVSEHTGYEYYYHNDPVMQGYEALPMYNTWDDIMPIVIKIEGFGGDNNEFDIFGNCVQLGDKEFTGKTKIDAVNKAIDWWISQYNR
jgi:hypothetical protein